MLSVTREVADHLLTCRAFPNLRQVELSGQVAHAEHIFNIKTTLESVKCWSETVSGASGNGMAQCWVTARQLDCFIDRDAIPDFFGD